MSLLSPEEQESMLGPVSYKCHKCGKTPIRNYCRECDEFFFICDCPVETGSSNNHKGHRTY